MGGGVARGFASATGTFKPVIAKSIAPRRTLNKAHTSPVHEAIFFVRRVNVAVGRNLLACSAASGHSEVS
jgi:hypothetical protein